MGCCSICGCNKTSLSLLLLPTYRQCKGDRCVHSPPQAILKGVILGVVLHVPICCEEEEEGVVRLDDKHFQVKLCRACGWGWKEEEDSMQSFTLNKQVYGFPIERPLAQHTRAWAARRAPWAACRLRPQGL